LNEAVFYVREPQRLSPIRSWTASSGGPSLRVCGENVIRRRCKRVAGSATLRVVPLRRLVCQGCRPEPAGHRVVHEHGVSPSVRVRKSLGVLLDELDLSQFAGHSVRRARGKRGIGQLIRFPNDLGNLGAIGERLAMARGAFFVGLDHDGIGEDHPNHVLGVGETRGNRLPLFVSSEIRECQAARTCRVYLSC
jgi:hypothetical protein